MQLAQFEKNKILKSGGVVILSLKEYERLRENAVPTYYLKGGKALRFDKKVAAALKEYKQGKTKKLTSLSDLR